MIRDRIPYEILVQGALRKVIHQVLEQVARDGLPGEHHFYITFHTHIAGVEMSERLKERYPDHVTIVLQNQFWDLVVEEDYFAVTLSFSDVPERLVVPFTALRAFYDPVAAFEANFDIVRQIPSQPQEATVSAPGILEEDALNNPPTTIPVAIKRQNNATKAKQPPEQTDEIQEAQSAQVLSLDAFRKK